MSHAKRMLTLAAVTSTLAAGLLVTTASSASAAFDTCTPANLTFPCEEGPYGSILRCRFFRTFAADAHQTLPCYQRSNGEWWFVVTGPYPEAL
jgi:hypothetical protein